MSATATEQDRLRLVDGEGEPEDALPDVVTNHRQVRDVVAVQVARTQTNREVLERP